MSSPERAVPRIPQSPAGNRPAWPQDQDIQNRKPPKRSFQHDVDDTATGKEDAEAARSDHDRQLDSHGDPGENGGGRSPTIPVAEQSRASGRTASTSAFQDLSSSARSAGNGLGDSASKVFNFPLRERLMNAREVADRLGVSERWVRDHTTRRSPKIRAVKLGTLIRYRPADVDTFMDHLDTLRPSGHTRFGV
jgi:predicted DNA-binding transcriptional regulator AlpA